MRPIACTLFLLVALSLCARSAGAAPWTPIQIGPETAPTAHAAIYDPVLHQLVAFGGVPGSYDGVDILRLEPTPAWSIRRIPRGPSSRTDLVAVFDSLNRRMLVIGGSLKADVWELPLDGPSNWHQLAPGGESPTGWSGHSAIVDAGRNRVLVFGGAQPGVSFSNEVWALDLDSTPTWHKIVAGGGVPLPRRDQTVVYDRPRDRMIVCDGAGASGPMQDVWALSLADPPVWNALLPTGAAPSARSGHTAVYDPVRDRMLIAQGRTTGGVWLNDVYALSLSGTPTWTTVMPAKPPSSTLAPRGRTQAALCYDSLRDRFLLFAGLDSLGYDHDTFESNLVGSATWQPLYPDWGDRPVGQAYRFAVDPKTGRAFAFGHSDLWRTSLDDPQPVWRRLATPGIAPSPRGEVTLIFDSRRDRLVLFGGSGFTQDVWTVGTDSTATWTSVTPAGPPPGGRAECSAVYDSTKDRVVFFGGYVLTSGNMVPFGNTFGLDFTGPPTWTSLPAGPPARLDASAMLDPARNAMTLFGGATQPTHVGPLLARNDLWQFDLTTDVWHQVPPSAGVPDIRWGAALAFDPGLDELAVLGGGSFNTALADASTLALDTSLWQSLPSMPSSIVHGAAFVQPGTHEITVVGAPWTPGSSVESPARAYVTLLPTRPLLDVVSPGTFVWKAGTVQPLDFVVTTDAPGPQIADYSVSCDRDWPGFPFAGFVDLNGSAHIPIGVPVPDSASAGVATIRLVATLRSDPAATDSADARLHDVTTATLATLVSADASPGQVRLTWFVPDLSVSYQVERRTAIDSWQSLGPVTPAADGVLSYDDRSVRAGERYTYGLSTDGSHGDIVGTASVLVPGIAFSLRGAFPNPAIRDLRVSFDLAATGPARLELFDVRGRRVRSLALEAGAGVHSASLGSDLPPGVYVVRLTQGNLAAVARVAVVR